MRYVQVAILAILGFAASVVFGAPVAFISNLKGEVAVDGSSRPALLTELASGQKLTVGKDSELAVMFIASGREFILKGPADYAVKADEVTGSMAPTQRNTEWRPSERARVQVAQSAAASVRMRSIAPQKAPEIQPLIYPTQGSIGTLQPTFRWRADPKAKGELVLMLADQPKPVHRAKTLGDSYRMPTKLLADREYGWTVSAAGAEIGSGKFHTLSSEAIAAIERRRPSDKAEFQDRLLFALMLNEMGATQEAREAWAKLARERTDLPELAAFAK